ncbi:hypothetical protein [Vulgatibacter sp.]|uniref:hypothetical protein n=1 Tax=Vulgatibacter sp. TaxID=1971226 RepID=UPI003561C035
MLILWRLVHTFGFILWFIGLFGTTAAQVAARKAADPAARRGAWTVVRRLQPFEIVGMILTPLGGIFLTTSIYGHLFAGTPAFVHIKLLLVIIAFVLNLVVIVKRRQVEERITAGDDAGFTKGVKRLAMLEGIATLMLPAAVVVVVVIKYTV